MVVAAELNIRRVPLKRLDIMIDRARVAMTYVEVFACDHGDLVIRHVDDSVGAASQWRRVACNKVLIIPEADDQRATESCGEDHIWMIAKDHHEPIGAAKMRNGLADDLHQEIWDAAPLAVVSRQLGIGVSDQMGNHFAIGLRCEAVAFGLQMTFEFTIVFDHAVVRESHKVVTAHVRVSVLFGRGAVCRPAGVSNSRVGRAILSVELFR